MALATAWLNKYRGDPFFRTEVNVIALQIIFGLVILTLVGVSFDLLYSNVGAAIMDGVHADAGSGTPDILANAIVGRIQTIRHANMLTIDAIVVLVTLFFGWIVARVTLAPARNALSAQKQFIGNIAHEIRTPLAIIKTNSELALLDGALTAELKQTLHSNVEELDRISDIINNLLSLSALVRPERMEFSTIDLGKLTSEVVEKFLPLAKKNEIEVTVRKSPQALVWGSPTALQQIIGNVVKNALMYTPRIGHVTVTVEPSGDRIALIVEDSGIGIPQKDLFRVFEPFYRAERSRTRSQGGTGLGLAIVSELVKLHQGKIIVRSAVGRGTTVNILLPAARKRAEVGGKELREGQHEIAVDFSRHS